MNTLLTDALFLRSETQDPPPSGGRPGGPVTAMTIETALPLVLTQDPALAARLKDLKCQYVPPTADITVHADDLTIVGRLRLPGCRVQLFTRVLRARPGADGQPAALVVDGDDLSEDALKLRPLDRGETAPGPPPQPKRVVGNPGSAGSQDTIFSGKVPGGRGMSAGDDPAQMHGAPGRAGTPGRAAGQVWIACGSFIGAAAGAPEPAPRLRLQACGGRGGRGQDGQPGAHGGPGGPGRRAEKAFPGGVLGPTDGGPGGQGGDGGAGGAGGVGGAGGSVTVFCGGGVAGFEVEVSGGPGGDPGEGGARGEGGEPGQGGAGISAHRIHFPRAADGGRGTPGQPGGRGAPAPPSTAGQQSLKAGDVTLDSLAAAASVTQLHMLVQRCRAVYLVTEPPVYKLLQPLVTDVEALPATGRNTVVLAMVGTALHLRVFDASGRQVVDRPQASLPQGAALQALRESFDIDIGTVLVAGGWLGNADVNALAPADRRQRLAELLVGWSKQPVAYWLAKPDAELGSCGAMVVFLRDMGIRDAAWFRLWDDDGHRNTLIAEHSGRLGRPDLQALQNGPLVRLGLGWCRRPALRRALGGRSEAATQALVAQVFALTGYVDAWQVLGAQFQWAVPLLSRVAADHPQAALAAALASSGFAMSDYHDRGLDVFGNTPAFVPQLKLKVHQAALDTALQQLDTVAACHDSLRQATADDTVRRGQAADAVAGAKAHKAQLNTQINALLESIQSSGRALQSLDTDLLAPRRELLDAFKGLERQVRDSFGLSPQTFFNCLSQLSFMSVHAPAGPQTFTTQAGTAASALAMGVSQLGAMMEEGLDSVLSDDNESVKKSLLIRRVSVVSKGLGLKAELQRRGAEFDTRSADRLLVDLGEFRELLDRFSRSLPNAKLRELLDSTITRITQRNLMADQYNAWVRERAALLAQCRHLALQQDEASALLASTGELALEPMLGFAAQLYERVLDAAVRQLYLASRALSFWALRPYSDFFELLGRSPGAIPVAQLRAAASSFQGDVLNAFQLNGRDPAFMPEGSGGADTQGVPVLLTEDMHPDFFDDLRSLGHAEFTLEPPSPRSAALKPQISPTRMAWTGNTRPDLDPAEPHPFCGMANVRLTKVRAWLLGPKPGQGMHRVTMVHLGHEQFCSLDGKPFPARTVPADETDLARREPALVVHEPKEIPFIYDATGLTLDGLPGSPRFTPGRLGAGTTGTVDGHLSFPGLRSWEALELSVYAPIGPFARWRLVVHPERNPDLDLAAVNRVLIDFHVFFHGFSEA